MRLNVLGRLLLVFIAMIGLLAVPACQTREEPSAAPRTTETPDNATNPASPTGSTQAAAEPLKDEIPPSELTAVMAAHFKGLGLMEQYEYRKAAEAFREIHTRAPGWIPGAINLAIALLNDSGVQAEAAKKAGGGAARQQLRRGLAASGWSSQARAGQPPCSLLPGYHSRTAGRPGGSPQALQARDRARSQRRVVVVLERQHSDRRG